MNRYREQWEVWAYCNRGYETEYDSSAFTVSPVAPSLPTLFFLSSSRQKGQCYGANDAREAKGISEFFPLLSFWREHFSSCLLLLLLLFTFFLLLISSSEINSCIRHVTFDEFWGVSAGLLFIFAASQRSFTWIAFSLSDLKCDELPRKSTFLTLLLLLLIFFLLLFTSPNPKLFSHIFLLHNADKTASCFH